MRKDKEQAIRLRKQGKSYLEISKELGVPKSTLSGWLKEIALSVQAKQRLQLRANTAGAEALIKRNRLQTEIARGRALKIRKNAAKEVMALMKSRLFLAGICLYWAEGYKKGAEGSKWKCVDFANSDPEMIKVIMKFLVNFCKIDKEKIKAQLIAHSNVDIKKGVIYWAELTGIPEKNFIRTCVSLSKSSKGKREKNCLAHGTLHIRVYNVDLFHKIIGWLDGLKKVLVY